MHAKLVIRAGWASPQRGRGYVHEVMTCEVYTTCWGDCRANFFDVVLLVLSAAYNIHLRRIPIRRVVRLTPDRPTNGFIRDGRKVFGGMIIIRP